MKFNPSKQFFLLLSLTTLFACSKHHQTPDQKITNKLSAQMGIFNFPCVDIWDFSGGGTFAWAVPYPCPVTANQVADNQAAIDRQRKADSIRKANSYVYKDEVYKVGETSPCVTWPGDYSYIPLFGTSAVNNNIDVLLADFTASTPATVTVYVWQSGILGGGVFISLQQGTVVKTFGFYPGTNYTYPTSGCGVSHRSHNTNLSVPGEIRNNSELLYSYSISKVPTGIQFQNLKHFLRNGTNTNFYNYNVGTFNEVHYALGALNAIGITTTYQNIAGANNYATPTTPYMLGQNLQLLTPPPGVTINLNGGVTPGVADIID